MRDRNAGHAQTWEVPNGTCPASCLSIPWLAGTDVWNSGVIPSYTSTLCTGLAGNGTTDDGPAIQTCINALATNHCALIPAGSYLINSTVRLLSNTCLRGAKAEGGPPFLPATDAGATTIIPGTSYQLTTQNFGSGNITPSPSFGTLPTTCTLSGTPQKGDTSLTLSGSCTISIGEYIYVFGNDDPTLVSATGTDGQCSWCGPNTGQYIMGQIVQITGFTSGTGSSGTVFTISRPLYYTPLTTSVTSPASQNGGTGCSGAKCTQPSGAKFLIYAMQTTQAGFENLRFDGSQHDLGGTGILLIQGCSLCWVENVETYEREARAAPRTLKSIRVTESKFGIAHFTISDLARAGLATVSIFNS